MSKSKDYPTNSQSLFEKQDSEKLYSSAYCISIVITVSALLLLRFSTDNDNSTTLGFYIKPIIGTLILPFLVQLFTMSICLSSISMPWNLVRGARSRVVGLTTSAYSGVGLLGSLLALFIYQSNPYYTPIFIILFISAMCLMMHGKWFGTPR